jgi:colanic acid/amylovoran biosynthesis glycosyltransferase
LNWSERGQWAEIYFPTEAKADMSPDQRPRVALFRKDLLPISETFIADQFFAYSRWRPSLIGYRFVPGIDLTGVKLDVIQKRKNIASDIHLKFIQHGQYFGYRSRRLRSMILNAGAELVHAHFGYDAALVYDVAMELNLPMLVTLHGTDVLTRRERWLSGENGRFFKRYPDKLQKMFSDKRLWFITVSNALRQSALALGAPPERTKTLYTGVDCGKFLPADSGRSKKNVLFVGRLVEFKGCEYLIRAMDKVQRHLPDIRLRVLGDGPLRSNLEKLAEQLRVNADFLGAAPRSTVISELASALTLCVPSLTDSDGNFEAFGMVILEAQASGVPVITSALGGKEGVVHDITGFVFQERDVSAIENAILLLAEDSGRSVRMGNAARDYACEKFSIMNCIAAVETFYDDVCADHRNLSRDFSP